MIEIPRDEADELIRTREAGWWAVNANPPVPHDRWIVVSIVHQDDKDYLCSTEEIKVVLQGYMPVPVLRPGDLPGETQTVVALKAVHNVTFSSGELYALVEQDVKHASRIKMPTVEGGVRYGGRRNRLQELGM